MMLMGILYYLNFFFKTGFYFENVILERIISWRELVNNIFLLNSKSIYGSWIQHEDFSCNFSTNHWIHKPICEKPLANSQAALHRDRIKDVENIKLHIAFIH